jgi:uroporphyrin-III C-methyltransferase / precorrin-2 dehydrogenase / sirohydrochlorin ferrochelatase
VDYFPAFLDVRGRRCLVVGGGDVAARKARLLLAAGAAVTVLAPRLVPELARLARGREIRHASRRFDAPDVTGHWLVVAATGDAAVQRDVRAAAEAVGVFCNSVDDVDNSSFITPAIVDRGAVVVAISSGGAAPVLARRLRARIEAQLPPTLAQLATFARRWRARVADRFAGIAERRRFWEQVFDGPAASSVHANRIAEADSIVENMLDEEQPDEGGAGQAWLVGAGPGDPELLTLRGLRALQDADVIVHDRLVTDAVLSLARRDAERIAVGKAPGCKENSQEMINALLVRLVASGKRVCRLKGGDPFIFGRGGEEVEALAAAGLPYQVVPGVTAAAGCAASAGIPLTHRDASQSVVLLTAHGKHSVDRLDWASLARDRQTLAFYMAVRRFPEVMNKLVAHGRPADTPIAIIEKGTTPQQRVLRGHLGQLTLLAAAHQVEAPAILVVGEVARFAAGSGSAGSGRGKRGGTGRISAIHNVANNQ